MDGLGEVVEREVRVAQVESGLTLAVPVPQHVYKPTADTCSPLAQWKLPRLHSARTWDATSCTQTKTLLLKGGGTVLGRNYAKHLEQHDNNEKIFC